MSIKETIKQEIAENTAIQNYFKQFSEYSIESFINSYAVYKGIWLKHGQRYANNLEHNGIKWISKASEHLQYIKQKNV